MQYLPPPNADKVLAIGFGTAGCRILAHLERTNLGIDNHVYVSCEKKDIDYASKSKKIFMPLEKPICFLGGDSLTVNFRNIVLMQYL